MLHDKKLLLGAFIVPFVGFISYFNAIKAGFAFDDNRAIIDNIDVTSKAPLVNVWRNDFWGTSLHHSGSHKSYRPLTVLTFRLNYSFGKLDPFGYHLVNVLLHCVNCSLLFTFAFYLFQNVFQPLIASLLFAVHPIHTEAVTGVVGRADVLACLFFLVSIISYVKATATIGSLKFRPNGTQWGYVSLSIMFAIAAMLSKETGITVLAACALYDAIFIAELRFNKPKASIMRAAARGCFKRMFCVCLATFLTVYWRLMIMNLRTPEFHAADNPAANHPKFQVRLLTFLYLPVFNFELLLYPLNLSFDWSMDAVPLIHSPADRRNVASAFFYAILCFTVFRFVKNSKEESWVHIPVCTDGKNKGTEKKEEESSASGSCLVSIVSLMNFKFNCMFTGSSTAVDHSKKIFHDRPHEFKTRTLQNGLNDKIGTAQHYPYDNTSQGERNKKPSALPNGSLNNNLSRKVLRNGRISAESKNFASGRCLSKTENIESFQRVDKDSLGVNSLFDESFNISVFSLAIAAISFLPATNLLFYVGFVIAERILYIPSIGYCLLFSVGFGCIWNTCRRLRIPMTCGFLCLLGLFIIRTVVRNQDWVDEEALYRSGLNINPAKAWANLGIILTNQGKFKNAEVAYRNAIQSRPNMADTHYNLGILLQKLNRYEESIVSYTNAIRFRPRLASAHLNLGLVFYENGQYKEALKVLTNAKDLNDFGMKNPKAHQNALTSIRYNIGKILFEQGKYKESVSAFQEAVDGMPSSFASHSLYNMLGQSYSLLGKPEEAERWYLKSLNVNQSHIAAHLAYARHLASIGELMSAEKWFMKALKLSPENPDTHFHYAQFLLKYNQLENGLKEMEIALQLNPNRLEMVSFAASAFREAGRYGKAEVFYKRAIKLGPTNPSSHMNLGALYHLTGRLDEAELSYLQAIKLNPNDELTISNLRKLRSVKARTRL